MVLPVVVVFAKLDVGSREVVLDPPLVEFDWLEPVLCAEITIKIKVYL